MQEHSQDMELQGSESSKDLEQEQLLEKDFGKPTPLHQAPSSLQAPVPQPQGKAVFGCLASPKGKALADGEPGVSPDTSPAL